LEEVSIISIEGSGTLTVNCCDANSDAKYAFSCLWGREFEDYVVIGVNTSQLRWLYSEVIS